MRDKIYYFYRRHRFAASVISVLLLFIFGLGGLILAGGQTVGPNDSHVISLYVDGKNLFVPSRSSTVDEFLKKAKITLGEGDIVEPSGDSKIEVDMFRVRVLRARPFTVIDGTKEYSALTAQTSPRLIAEAAGLSLKPADKVEFIEPQFSDSDQIGRSVNITRSKNITLSLYGSLQQVSTNSVRVADLLDELKILPAPDDEVSPALASEILDGSSVFVNRKGVKVITEEEVIEPDVEYILDDSLTVGSSAVRDPGRPGKRVVTYQILTENDIELSRQEISSVIVEQPITKIVARGRAAGQIGPERIELMRAAGISEAEFGAVDFVIGHESGWCATKWQGQWGQCPSFYQEKYPGAESDRKLGYGLCQSTPANKMASAGEDWRTNPLTQLKWCTSYAIGRYGSWTAAYEFWLSHSWW